MAAAEGNTYALGNAGGAPTKYKEEYAVQAYKLCLLGATDEELADFFDVCEKTINNWKEEHEEFLQSITRGKKVADMEVAHSLYQSTQDRVVTEQQAFVLKETVNGEGSNQRVEVVELERVIPADFRAQQFWLKNRQGGKWKDKTEVDNNIRTEPTIIKWTEDDNSPNTETEGSEADSRQA
ncbi:MAG: hypothetical protein EOP56_09345 [Sphingobacteriales bacterium]|nr:MAG: hypothetical protein EOP56_09345 [Sphingobacteriales bacterium]